MSERILGSNQKELSDSSPDGSQPHLSQLTDLQTTEHTIEILVEGQECPFYRFAKLKKEYDEITCPICGYGHKPST